MIDLQTHEHRALLRHDLRQFTSQILKVAKLIGVLESGISGHRCEVELAGTWYWLTAGGEVHAVFEDEVNEVRRSGLSDCNECAEVHQERAVAVETENLLVRLSQCDPQCD